MIVQSFYQEHVWWDDFKAFGVYMDTNSKLGKLSKTLLKTSVPTYIGWVTGHPKYLLK